VKEFVQSNVAVTLRAFHSRCNQKQNSWNPRFFSECIW